LIDGLVRRDGSSLFGRGQPLADVLPVSGAYRVSQDFHINGIDELKLRASYGIAGPAPGVRRQYETFAVVGGVPVKQTLGNRTLKPARSAETEVGANIEFLGRFTLEYSYSRKETKDQILLVPLSAATGYKNQWQNAATLLGKTHELALARCSSTGPTSRGDSTSPPTARARRSLSSAWRRSSSAGLRRQQRRDPAFPDRGGADVRRHLWNPHGPEHRRPVR